MAYESTILSVEETIIEARRGYVLITQDGDSIAIPTYLNSVFINRLIDAFKDAADQEKPA